MSSVAASQSPVRALALLACLLVASVAARADVVDRIVAVVGDRIVTLSEVRGVLELGLVATPQGSEAERHAVQFLVDRTLMLEEVDRYGPGEPDAVRLAERLDALRRQFGGDRLEQVLARNGLDAARLRAWLRDQLRLERYLAQRFGAAAQPTDEEVLAFYRGDPSPYVREGVALPIDQALEAARQTLVERRRTALVAEWLESLRRRAHVVVKYPAAVSP